MVDRKAPARVATARLRSGPVRLSDRIADDLEAQILRGDISPGALLPPEVDLRAGFGVSRTVIRDALRTLDARGLIESRPGRGTTVREPNEEALTLAVLSRLMRSDLSLLDVVRARATIDINLVPLAAATAREEHIEGVKATFAAFSAAIADGRWEAVDKAHAAFHVGLLDAIGMPALRVILSPMQQVIMLSGLQLAVTSQEAWDGEVPLHAAIVDALATRDAGRLREAVEEHYRWVEAYSESREILFRDVPAVAELVRSRFYLSGREGSG